MSNYGTVILNCNNVNMHCRGKDIGNERATGDGYKVDFKLNQLIKTNTINVDSKKYFSFYCCCCVIIQMSKKPRVFHSCIWDLFQEYSMPNILFVFFFIIIVL